MLYVAPAGSAAGQYQPHTMSKQTEARESAPFYFPLINVHNKKNTPQRWPRPQCHYHLTRFPRPELLARRPRSRIPAAIV